MIPSFRNLVRKPSWILLLLCALAIHLPAHAARDDDDSDFEEGCPEKETQERNIADLEERLARAKTEESSSSISSQSYIISTQNELSRARTQLINAEAKCKKRTDARNRAFAKCDKKDGKLYRWNDEKQVCEDIREKNAKANPNSGDCNNAEIVKGQLKGQNCKIAADAVKDVSTRQEAVGATALAATQAYSTMQASQATGQQADAAARQQKILQGMAAMKLATGVLAMSGAATLKSAASGAEDASKNISSAHKDLYDYCNQDAKVSKMTMEQCFYKHSAERGVPANAENYATFERLRSAADQSQEQADRANALAKTAMVTGAADTLVGLQALYMSRQQAQTAANYAPPPIPPVQGIGLNAMMAAGTGGSIGSAGGAPPVAGDSGDGIGLGGEDGAQIKGGIGGKLNPNYNRYSPQKSGVTGGGGGMGGGGGGRGGGSGASRKGGAKGNTKDGEYTSGGAGVGFRGGNGDKDAAAGANPLADMMSKLFPPNEAGKPVIDARDVASTETSYDEPEEQGGGVTVAELSLFERINSKMRQFNGAGEI